MRGTISIHRPELFHIKDGLNQYYGANQIWYSTHTKRVSGCGPTTCSHIMWYLSQTREEYKNLCNHNGNEKQGFIQLMDDVWNYVTPGFMGVNKTDIFTEGAIRYGMERECPMEAEVLRIPALPFLRPNPEEIAMFLERAFKSDYPVAFLNLSNGALKNLESWHWVTLVSYNPDTHTALMYDQGLSIEIDLLLWQRTTLQGGGFVVLKNATHSDVKIN